MTVLTKPSIVKRFDIIKTPLVDDVIYDAEKIEIHDAGMPHGRMFRMLRALCVVFVVFLVVASSIMSCLVLYHNYTHLQMRPPVRLQAFCAVPVDQNDLQEQFTRRLEFRMMNSHAAEPFSELIAEFRAYNDEFNAYNKFNNDEDNTNNKNDHDDDIISTNNINDDDDTTQVISAMDDQNKSESAARVLKEQLDIGTDFEKIIIPNYMTGYTIHIHDWTTNISGIVLPTRCFVLNMNHQVVLPPSEFMTSIQEGGQFDVSPVDDDLTAILKPIKVEELEEFGRFLSAECRYKPTYRLQNEEQLGRVRRSADSPAPVPHFVHFSGRHVHQIHVTNMAELLLAEKEK